MKAAIREPASLDELPDFCSLEELAGVFRISRSMAYRMAAQGSIPCLRVGRRVIVSKEHLKRWVDRTITCEIDMGDERNGKT